jgi:mRNA interferase HigB
MRVFGRSTLDECSRRHAEARDQLETWRRDVEGKNWKTPLDIKASYPSASIIGGKCVVFDIKGKKYRIVAKVNYERSFVRILFAGTHNEYNRFDVAGLCGE